MINFTLAHSNVTNITVYCTTNSYVHYILLHNAQYIDCTSYCTLYINKIYSTRTVLYCTIIYTTASQQEHFPLDGLVYPLHPSFVTPQEIVTAWTGVGNLLHTVHTTRNAGTTPEPYKTEQSPHDPGHHTGLRLCSGGDVSLAVWAVHGHWSVAETGSIHILDLCDHSLGRWLLGWRIGCRRLCRRIGSLLRR